MLFANLKHHSQNGIIKKQMHGKWWHLYKEDQSLTPEMSRMLQALLCGLLNLVQ